MEVRRYAEHIGWSLFAMTGRSATRACTLGWRSAKWSVDSVLRPAAGAVAMCAVVTLVAATVTHAEDWPEFRGKGLAKIMVAELIRIARETGLEKLEAEFLGDQERARHVFAELGFHEMLTLPDYVKDMQAIAHDYVLMGRNLITDEEYTAAAG